ncbi:MAG: heavy metal-binding domain-containing protein [Ginsengibacter sp.]
MKKLFIVSFTFLSFTTIFASCNNGSNKVDPAPSTATAQNPGAQLASDSMYTCKMHDSVMSDHPGKCTTCGMELVKEKMTVKQQKMMKDNTYIKPKE